MADTYYVTVAVVNRTTKTGMSGVNVNVYGGDTVKTGFDGKVTVASNKSWNSIYVEGVTVYDGSFSSAPNPIIVYRD